MGGVRRSLSLAVGVAAVALMTLVPAWAQTGSQPAAPSQPAPAPAQTPAPAVTSGPEQPIPFSHKVHAGTLQLPCESCHAMSRSGETLMIPQAAVCMECHQTMATSNPGVQKLAEYAKNSETIPWVRVYQLPSFVTFSHKMHLTHGNTCEECHGPVAQRDQLFQEEDISMAACLNCHRAKKASVECNTCHVLPE